MRRCLNLGCGRDYRESTDEEQWHNVDHCESVRANAHFDLEDKWLLPSNTYDHVLIKHVLEHISALTHFMEELYRVCKPGATVEVIAPYPTHFWCWGDPDHKRAISDKTFIFYSKEQIRNQPPGSPMTPMDITCDFRTTSVDYIVDSDCKWWEGLDREAQLWCAHHLNNVIATITVQLEVIKDGQGQ